MRKKMIILLAAILIFISVLSGCAFKATNGSAAPSATADIMTQLKMKDDRIAAITSDNEALKKQIKSMKSGTALNLALTIVNLLNDKDFAALADYVHPVKGVRFSPYANVLPASDKVFLASQIAAFYSDTTSYTWGTEDGSGLPITMIPAVYYDKFIYDADFATPEMIGINNEIGKGNTPNNIGTVYPGDIFVEFHFSGFDAQYGGMDWKSLRLVFEDVGGTLFLVGIVHAQWTI